MDPRAFLSQYFRNPADSDATANLDMNVDGTTAVNFDVVATGIVRIERVTMTIVDGSIGPSSFGGITALTNGLRVVVLDGDGAEVKDFLDGDAIKTNDDFSILTGTDALIRPAAGDDHLPIRWTLHRHGGAPLDLFSGWTFRIIVRDDLTGLTKFRAFAQGKQ